MILTVAIRIAMLGHWLMFKCPDLSCGMVMEADAESPSLVAATQCEGCHQWLAVPWL